MALRGKDYCNCEHASILRNAIRKAHDALKSGERLSAARLLREALEEDSTARLDLWSMDPFNDRKRVRK